jgi:hypothetical protein
MTAAPINWPNQRNAYQYWRLNTMVEALDLSPLVDGYNWLLEHEGHFKMNHWIERLVGKDSHGFNKYEALMTIPTEPECGTVLCLCGAALLVNAKRQKSPTVMTEYGSGAIIGQFMNILREVNQQWQGDWSNVEGSLERLFMGDYFDEEFDVDIDNVTLELAREGVEWICDRWGHVPVFIEPNVEQQFGSTLPENYDSVNS